MSLPHTPAVLTAILTHADIMDATRNAALSELAVKKHTTTTGVLLDGIAAEAPIDPGAAAGLARLLPQQPPSDLKAARDHLMALATRDPSPDVRQPAWAAITTGDGSYDTVWPTAAQSTSQLIDLLESVPQVFDQSVRQMAYDKIAPLLAPTFPSNIPAAASAGNQARALRTSAIRAIVSIDDSQKQTFEALVNLVRKGLDVPVAAEGLRVLPRKHWDMALVAPATHGLINWAKNVPAGERATPDYLQVIQLAADFAGTLPANEAAPMRKQLHELRVQVFVVNTVREQMRYDTPRLVVEAGKPFQVIFQNQDFMPHNFCVVKPGTRATIGKITATMTPDQLDRQHRPYVPANPDILAATNLIAPGQSQTLKLTAPTAEGNYEYMCTFPGHWELMWGTLVVTKDVDAYLAAHPDATPIKGPTSGHEHHMQH
jgi:azurin